MASIKGIMVNASKFMDCILQSYMRNTHSYCKNATHMINLLRRTFVPIHSYLASLDIESLYMNISFDVTMKVFLKIFGQKEKLVCT